MFVFDLNEWLNGSNAEDCEFYIDGIYDVVEFMENRGEDTSTIIEILCENFGEDYETVLDDYISGESDIYTR